MSDGPGRHRPPASLGIDGYEGAALIGEGGFASVYRSRQPAFDRLVAVKVLSKVRLDQRALRQFDRERASIGSLSGHPNIVTVYEAGITDAEIPYLAMEYLPKGSLGDRLVREGPLRWEEVAHIGVRLAGALESAHRAGILHRDVKPENVLMSEFNEPQLTDFGIARMLGAAETRTVNQAVSVAHAAPEVLNGAPFSPRSDVYSLGSTLFTLLWGSPPFLRDDDELLLTLLVRITTLPLPDLLGRGVPEQVCRALESAMAKDPADRPASALDLAELLRAAESAAGRAVTVPFVTGVAPATHAAGAGSSPAEEPTRVVDRSVTETIIDPTDTPGPRPAARARSRWLLLALPLLVAAVAVTLLRGREQPVGAPPPQTTATSATTATSSTTTTLAPALPFPTGTDPVKAGRYVAPRFTVPFEFELPDGWRATSLAARNELELVRADGDGSSSLTFLQITEVFDNQLAPSTPGETSDAVRPAPADLVQWLQAHPRLTTGRAAPVTRGGLSGMALDLQVSLGYPHDGCEGARPDRRCVLLFVNAENVFYALPQGYRALVYVLRLGDQTLVATVEAPPAAFDRFSSLAEQVLATLGPRR